MRTLVSKISSNRDKNCESKSYDQRPFHKCLIKSMASFFLPTSKKDTPKVEPNRKGGILKHHDKNLKSKKIKASDKNLKVKKRVRFADEIDDQQKSILINCKVGKDDKLDTISIKKESLYTIFEEDHEESSNLNLIQKKTSGLNK